MVGQIQEGGTKERRKKSRPLLEPAVEGAHAGNSKLARALGSCDFHTREKGVHALTKFLQRKTELAEKDMLKIWKGLFYAFWHSDKLPVQTELAERLAAVFPSLQPEVAFLYFTCFIKTMRREWFGIDRLRLDKFLMLIRIFVGQLFRHMAASKWEDALVSRYSDFFCDSVLLPSDGLRAVGVSYHLSDIFLPELKKAVAASAAAGLGEDKAAVSGPALRTLLSPFCKVLVTVGDQPVSARIREAVFDALLQEVHSPEDGDPLRHLDVQALATQLFDLGAQPETRPRNREVLYGVSEALERSLVKRQKREAAVGRPASGAKPAGPNGAAGPAAGPKQAEAAQASPVAAASEDARQQAATQGKKKKRKLDALANGSVPAAAAAEPRPVGSQPAAAQKQATTSSPASSEKVAAAGSAGKKAKLAKLVPGLGPGAGVGGMNGAQSQQEPAEAAVASSSAVKPKSVNSAVKPKSVLKAKPSANGHAEPSAAASAAVVHENAPSVVGKPGEQTPAATTQGKRKRSAGAAGAGSVGPTGGKSVAPQSTKKKVQINLKKNLYFDFGGPVPPAEVRTPSRAKGGILKSQPEGVRSAPPKVGHAKVAVEAPQKAGSQSVGKPQLAQGAGRKGAPRAKAALFF